MIIPISVHPFSFCHSPMFSWPRTATPTAPAPNPTIPPSLWFNPLLPPLAHGSSVASPCGRSPPRLRVAGRSARAVASRCPALGTQWRASSRSAVAPWPGAPLPPGAFYGFEVADGGAVEFSCTPGAEELYRTFEDHFRVLTKGPEGFYDTRPERCFLG